MQISSNLRVKEGKRIELDTNSSQRLREIAGAQTLNAVGAGLGGDNMNPGKDKWALVMEWGGAAGAGQWEPVLGLEGAAGILPTLPTRPL